MDEQLFIYGTLKRPEVQKKIIGRFVNGIPSILEGFTISKVVIEGVIYPIIVPKKGSSIRGWIFSLTKGELRKIDEYETNVYKRKKVTLKSGEIAWVYMK